MSLGYSITLEGQDEAFTERLGTTLAELLADGGVVALDGVLGAGKTRLVQAVASALGVNRLDVVSPTFVLVHEYRAGSRPIIHIDAYRIADDDEFLQLGIHEYYDPPNLVLIEWASRISRCLPPERLEIAIEVLDDHTRRFLILGYGAKYSDIAKRLASTLCQREHGAEETRGPTTG